VRFGDARIKVATISLVASVVLVSIKLGAYIATGSLSVMAEVLHSLLDFFATVVTLSAVSYASKPPDMVHHYGHGKAENLGGLAGALMIMATSLWVLYEGIERLIHSVAFTPSLIAVAVMASSMAVDYERSKALFKAAKSYHSQALEADALHFSSDLVSAASVLAVVAVGVALSLLANPYEFALVLLDVSVAAFVSAWFAWQGYHLSMRAISELLDKAPVEVVAEAERIALGTDGVLSVKNIRSRRSGSRVFMDMVVTVAEGTEITQAHETASEVERAVKESLGDLDLVIHMEPATHDELKNVITALASKVPGVKGVHAVMVSEAQGSYNVRLHVGVDPKETVEGAHKVAEEVEHGIKEKDPSVSTVIVHTEPFKPVISYDVVEAIKSFLAGSTALRMDNVFVETIGEVTYVDIICVAQGSAQLAGTHDLVTLLEDHVRELLGRDVFITVHMEPIGAPSPA
jgi:cation diffusion facilitator family transporter